MRILVIGDSSSSGIGHGLDVYPYRLFCLLQKLGAVEVQNHSAPGLTSADAARYFNMRLSRGCWDAVIVYLGNNESGPSAHKGRYNPFMDKLGLRPRRSPRRPPSYSVLGGNFDLSENDPPPAPGPATTPGEFGQNLSLIINLARASGAQVILVNPLANRAYPASAGPLLSPFFKIIGSPSRIGDSIESTGETAALIRDAIRAQEMGHHELSIIKYNSVLSRRRPPPWLVELASNNLAVLFHQTGRSHDAEQLLTTGTSGESSFRSIPMYNLARLLHAKGKNHKAEEYFGAATEQDRYLYRIKEAYRDAIAQTAATSGAHLLDLATILTADMFVDYCHPTSEAHNEIAKALHSILRRVEAKHCDQHSESRYQNYYPSPNAYEYCSDDLLDYYDIVPSFSATAIEKEMGQITVKLGQRSEHHVLRSIGRLSVDSGLQRSIVEALKHQMQHPMITSIDDLRHWPLRDSCELGRLPEHYLYRLLLAYADWAYTHEISWELGDDDKEGQSDLRAYYRRLMIGRPEGNCEAPIQLDDGYRRRLRRQVLTACQDEALFRDRRGERLMTVLRWYTREAFRYGTQSRLSMLYPVVRLDSIFEALRVWIMISRFRCDPNDEHLILSLHSWLRGLERIHRVHAEHYVSQGYWTTEEDATHYSQELLRWKSALPSIIYALRGP